MATNMAPHNLREVVQGICAYIDNRNISIEELMKFIKAPDFPTGGIIYGYDGVREAFLTGKGKVVIRALAQIETNKQGKEKIIITEIPYMVNKAALVAKIAELMKEGKLDGISEVRDESDREGLRIVVEIKKDGDANVVLNQLYKNTALQTSFGVNNVALVKGRPMTLNLKDLIVHYVEHRHEVVVRRTQYDLDQALQRAHILEGLIIALDNLDAVIALIRSAATPEVAKNGLMSQFNLSEIQAKAILDMRLQRLTGLEMDKIRQEYDEIMKKIAYFREVLANEPLRMQIIKEELNEVAKEYGDERRTQIVYSAEDFSIEDMIANEDVVITITHEGYIKRTAINNYKRQGRGGIGAKGTTTKEEDFVEHLFIASTHNYLLFFTEKGKCYWLKAFEIPEGSKASKGRSIRNLIQIENDDKIKAFINIANLDDKEFIENHFIVMVTRKGTIKKTAVKEYSRPRSTGIIAINIEEGDELIDAQLTDGNNEIVIATHQGMAIRFNESTVRDMGRNATGVKGITLEEGDFVIGMVVVKHPDTQLLVVSEKGYGKRSKIDEYRLTNRGGKGVKTIHITPKTGHLIAIKPVLDTDDLMIITKENNMIRTSVSSIREAGRNTQGVILIRLKEGDDIAAVAKIAEKDDENIQVSEQNSNELFDE
jgi:DNA gyrase subunit A